MRRMKPQWANHAAPALPFTPLKLGLALLLLAGASLPAQTNNFTGLLQQGLFEEQANRNLDAAIADYQALAAQFDKDRQAAATAVFRLGECYRAQGKTNEAAAQYQRVLRDFSDQAAFVTLSRQNLTGLGMTQTETTPLNNADARLWDQVKNLPPEQLRQVLPTLAPNPLLISLMSQRNAAAAHLAEVSHDFGEKAPAFVAAKDSLTVLDKSVSEQIAGVMQALKIRAELAQPGAAVASAAQGDEEDQEIQRLQQMIRDSPDLLNGPYGGTGLPPLVQAAAGDHLKVARFLLDHGAKVDIGIGHGDTPLLVAALNGHKAMVELLLGHGANANAKGNGGDTALLLAARDGFEAVVGALLAAHGDANARDEGGYTPLQLAAERGHGAIVLMLLAAGADPNIAGANGGTALSAAANGGSPEMVKSLLDAGANPNMEDNRGRTPLSYAAENGTPEIVRELLAAKADPNGGKIYAPLLCAINKGDTASAGLLFGAGANPNAFGAMHWGPDFRADSIFERMDPQRFNGQFAQVYRVTPLSLAIYRNQPEMVNLLLKSKADPNLPPKENRSLLFMAGPNAEMLDALLKAGAQVDERINGRSALEVDVTGDDVAAVETLLRHGANPNARDDKNNTALHLAADRGQQARGVPASRGILEALLKHNANPNARNDDGETPLTIIEKMGQSAISRDSVNEIVELLRQHGARDDLPDWDGIQVSRPAAKIAFRIFRKDPEGWNRYTLLEAVYHAFRGQHASLLTFPDLNRVAVARPSRDSTNVTRIEVDLLKGTNEIDCAKDMPLEFGDVVEIPAVEHAPWASPIGLTFGQEASLVGCLRGTARLVFHDYTMMLTLSPAGDGPVIATLLSGGAQPSLASHGSDLSRVKVTRCDPKTGKNREWVLNCQPPSAPHFLVRNNDVIELGEFH